MGTCCATDNDRKQLDFNEERFMVHEMQKIPNELKKPIPKNLSYNEQSNLFDMEVSKVKSMLDQVNVLLLIYQDTYEEKGHYVFKNENEIDNKNLALKELKILNNGDIYYGFW